MIVFRGFATACAAFTLAVGAFFDGNSALILVAARLRHIVGTQRGKKRYLDMSRLKELDHIAADAAAA